MQKVERGCSGAATKPIQWDGQLRTLCPLRPFYDNPAWYNSLVESYTWMKRGSLPDPGTWRDQPALLLDAWQVVDQVVADLKEAEDRRHQAKMAAAQQKAGGGASTTRRGKRR